METRRRANSLFVLCQEEAIPDDRFRGLSLKLSKGLITPPDAEDSDRACLPLLFPFSFMHFGFGYSAIGLGFFLFYFILFFVPGWTGKIQ